MTSPSTSSPSTSSCGNVLYDPPKLDPATKTYFATAHGPGCQFQLPRGFIALDASTGKGTITFAPGKRATFVTDLIHTLEQDAQTQTHTHSAAWFNGKVFSTDSIAARFSKSMTSDALNVSYKPGGLVVFDAFKDLVDPIPVVMKGSTIVKYRGLTFSKKVIQPIFELHQVKLAFEPQLETVKPKACLLDDDAPPRKPPTANTAASPRAPPRPATGPAPADDDDFESILGTL